MLPMNKWKYKETKKKNKNNNPTNEKHTNLSKNNYNWITTIYLDHYLHFFSPLYLFVRSTAVANWKKNKKKKEIVSIES